MYDAVSLFFSRMQQLLRNHGLKRSISAEGLSDRNAQAQCGGLENRGGSKTHYRAESRGLSYLSVCGSTSMILDSPVCCYFLPYKVLDLQLPTIILLRFSIYSS